MSYRAPRIPHGNSQSPMAMMLRESIEYYLPRYRKRDRTIQNQLFKIDRIDERQRQLWEDARAAVAKYRDNLYAKTQKRQGLLLSERQNARNIIKTRDLPLKLRIKQSLDSGNLKIPEEIRTKHEQNKETRSEAVAVGDAEAGTREG